MTERIVITGGPRTGKTTLAKSLGMGVTLHSDDVIALGWSEASLAVSHWFDAPGPWVIEGVALPRALRKWLDRNSEGAPCDVLIWLGKPRVALTPGQHTMAKGVATVMVEIDELLRARGVKVEAQ